MILLKKWDFKMYKEFNLNHYQAYTEQFYENEIEEELNWIECPICHHDFDKNLYNYKELENGTLICENCKD
jgi:hypothetical protein